MAKILPLKKTLLRSSEDIKIQALNDKVTDLESKVTRLSAVVVKLLRLLKKEQ